MLFTALIVIFFGAYRSARNEILLRLTNPDNDYRLTTVIDVGRLQSRAFRHPTTDAGVQRPRVDVRRPALPSDHAGRHVLRAHADQRHRVAHVGRDVRAVRATAAARQSAARWHASPFVHIGHQTGEQQR